VPLVLRKIMAGTVCTSRTHNAFRVGFNSRRLPEGSNVEFEEETSITYEVGIKSTALDRRLLLNATVFLSELKDFQEATLSPTGTGFIVGNAGTQEVRGIEADLTWLATEHLTINGSLAYLDSEYTDFPQSECGVGEIPDNPDGTCDRTGETPAFAPEWQYTIGALWLQPFGDNLQWWARADWAWVDDQNQIRGSQDAPGVQEGYGLLNLRAGLGQGTGGWEVEAYVNNATDKAYFVQGARQPVGGLVSGGGFAGARGIVGWYGPPRMWGLQLTWRPGLN
jgi:iron complex outermembrane receptor protein